MKPVYVSIPENKFVVEDLRIFWRYVCLCHEERGDFCFLDAFRNNPCLELETGVYPDSEQRCAYMKSRFFDKAAFLLLSV